MNTILFSFPGNEKLTQSLAEKTGIPIGELEIRKFPDGETFAKIISEVKDCRAIIVCSLDRPDEKILPLYFICKTLKEFGALRVELVAPYLAYMRQDKRFHEGEAVTSDAFAALLSGFIDCMLTVDPHLHRHHSLSEIYSIPTTIIPAAEVVAGWIKNNIQKPLLIGPDEESGQWVKEVAKSANAPFEILFKKRKGDNDVEVSIPHV
ncbi:MAG TPA: ribose-phosphate diphosphokinase, partial [Bacteroidia bacterium]|nr:ribose-phosphate diphosphokinase [Bacteroidia bacterium]